MPRPYALPPYASLTGGLAFIVDNNGTAVGSVGKATLDQLFSWCVAQLATVATTGSYTDLINKPTIPSAYTLPTADATTLGGIKVGANLTMMSGVLSAPTPTGGTVTSTSVVTANGVSGVIATPTTTPAITLTLGNITPTSVAAVGTVTGSNLSGTNTGDATITLTGDVTGTGTGTFAATIPTGTVTLVKQAPLAANSLVGNNSGVSTTPLALNPTQVKTLLAIVATDVSGLATVATTGVYSDLTGKPTSNCQLCVG